MDGAAAPTAKRTACGPDGAAVVPTKAVVVITATGSPTGRLDQLTRRLRSYATSIQ